MDRCTECLELKKENKILRDQVDRLIKFALTINNTRECECNENGVLCSYHRAQKNLNDRKWGLRNIKIKLTPRRKQQFIQ